MEIVSKIALITINETLFVQLISFLLFMVIMDRVMFRPLRKVINDRDGYIRKMETEITDAEKELEDVNKKLETESSAIRREALEMKEALEHSGSRKAVEIFDATRKEISGLKDKTEKEIDAQISEATKYIKTESEVLAVSIMEKILDRRLIQ